MKMCVQSIKRIMQEKNIMYEKLARRIRYKRILHLISSTINSKINQEHEYIKNLGIT